jgi:hypothetical protein
LFIFVAKRSIVGEPHRSRTAWTMSMCSVHSVETSLFDLEWVSASMVRFPGVCRGTRTMFSRRQNRRSSHVAVEAWTRVVDMNYRPFVQKGFHFRSRAEALAESCGSTTGLGIEVVGSCETKST